MSCKRLYDTIDHITPSNKRHKIIEELPPLPTEIWGLILSFCDQHTKIKAISVLKILKPKLFTQDYNLFDRMIITSKHQLEYFNIPTVRFVKHLTFWGAPCKLIISILNENLPCLKSIDFRQDVHFLKNQEIEPVLKKVGQTLEKIKTWLSKPEARKKWDRFFDFIQKDDFPKLRSFKGYGQAGYIVYPQWYLDQATYITVKCDLKWIQWLNPNTLKKIRIENIRPCSRPDIIFPNCRKIHIIGNSPSENFEEYAKCFPNISKLKIICDIFVCDGVTAFQNWWSYLMFFANTFKNLKHISLTFNHFAYLLYLTPDLTERTYLIEKKIDFIDAQDLINLDSIKIRFNRCRRARMIKRFETHLHEVFGDSLTVKSLVNPTGVVYTIKN